MYKVAVVIFAIVGTSLAQVVVDGSCPKVKVVQDFSAAKFAGSWYEAERFSSETETGAKCNVANYFFNGDGTANITYSSVGAKGQAFNLVGSAVYREPVGQLNISIPQLGSGTFDYLILDSDYDNWTSFFVCRERGNNQHQRYVWLVTRQQVAAEAHLVAARKAVTDQGISLDPLEVVNQKNC